MGTEHTVSRWSQRKPIATGATLILLAAFGGGLSLAGAATATTNAVYSACASNGKVIPGTIMVNQTPACAPSQSVVSWNQAGVPGPKGDTGATGPAGPAGPPGADGMDGVRPTTEVVTWSGTLGDGQDTMPELSTNTVIEEGSTLKAVTGKLTMAAGGTLSIEVDVTLPNATCAISAPPTCFPLGLDKLANWSFADIDLVDSPPNNRLGDMVAAGADGPLKISAFCEDAQSHLPKPCPVAQFSITIEWTHPPRVIN